MQQIPNFLADADDLRLSGPCGGRSETAGCDAAERSAIPILEEEGEETFVCSVDRMGETEFCLRFCGIVLRGSLVVGLGLGLGVGDHIGHSSIASV